MKKMTKKATARKAVAKKPVAKKPAAGVTTPASSASKASSPTYMPAPIQSTGWAPLSKNLSNFFSRRERGTVMGLWCTNYPIGGLIALLLAGYAGDAYGWRYAFFVPAAALLIIAILFLLLQRNRPEDVGLPSIETYHEETPAVLVAGESPLAEPEGRVSRAVPWCLLPRLPPFAGGS